MRAGDRRPPKRDALLRGSNGIGRQHGDAEPGGGEGKQNLGASALMKHVVTNARSLERIIDKRAG